MWVAESRPYPYTAKRYTFTYAEHRRCDPDGGPREPGRIVYAYVNVNGRGRGLKEV